MMLRSPLLTVSTICLGFLLIQIPFAAAPALADVATESDSEFAAGPLPEYEYRNYSTIKEIMLGTEASYPDIAKVVDIGDGWEKTQGLADRDILAIKISDNVGMDEDEPEVLIMALHHAREWPTSEIAIQLIDNLTSQYGVDSRISWLVDNRETWVIPVVNPDGLDFSMSAPENELWRKNRRDNGDGTFGVDLNRNYNGSQNGDPLGEWGGAGTSSNTWDITYCGEYPFSEPETQAIRDLALNRSFTAAIDFHTYSDLVMWPWGYTTNKTPDDVDFVRIGNELAALNGYVADQSVGLYPTTGDSLDWLYGGTDVFAFLFEVGGNPDGYHPTGEDVVLEQIAENIPPALLLIEIAGDRHERQFDIDHQPLSSPVLPDESVYVNADITAGRGVDTTSLNVRYRVDEGSWLEVPMLKVDGNDTYEAELPAVPSGSNVDYYINARDNGGVSLSSPKYAPYDLHSFEVLADEENPVADAGPDIATQVGTPVVFNGQNSTDNVGIINYTWTFEYDSNTIVLYGATDSHTFWLEGEYLVTLEVRDGAGNTDTDTVTVVVSADVIPEFSNVILPSFALLALFVLLRRRRTE